MLVAALAESSDAALARRDYGAALWLDARRFERIGRDLPAGDPRLIEPLVRLGSAHRRCGILGRAEVELVEALRLVEADAPRSSLHAEALHELGLVYKDTSRRLEARRLFDRAWGLARGASGRDPALAASICRTLGNWELRWGTVQRALPWYRRSLAIAEGSPLVGSDERAEAQTWLGFALLRAGRHDEAGACFRRALELLPPAGGADPPAARSALDLLSVVEVVGGRYASAESLLRRSTSLADAEAELQPHGFGFGVSHPSLRLGLMDVLLHEGHPEEAWEQGQVWAGWVTDAIAIDRGRHGASDRPLTGASAVEERLRALEARIARSQSSARAAEEQDQRVGWLTEMAGLEAARIAPLLGARSERTRAGARPPALAGLQRALRADEAFVGWHSVDWDDDLVRGGLHTVWGYVVRHGGPVHWVRLGAWKREAGYLEWFHALDECERRILAAAEWPVRVPADPALDSLEARLGARLWTPLARHLEGARRIVAVYQILNRWVPLECLRGEDGRELVEPYEIAYTPSARAFTDLRERAHPPRDAEAPVLVVGDPAYAGEAGIADAPPPVPADWTRASVSALEPTLVRSVLSGEGEVGSLPRLPQARAEARAVAARHPGATLLLGRGATKAALEALRLDGRLKHFAMLHFATHALVENAFPERSAIALAPRPVPRAPAAGGGDGLLRAGEIYDRWDLEADLVTLSSCQTAAGRFTWSAQSLGLPQAFLHAGARSLLLSPWKVDDLATRALMESFNARIAGATPAEALAPAGKGRRLPPISRGPVSRSAALREAKLALRDFRAPDGTRPFAHPAYWAGFILIGDPGGPPEAAPARR